VSDGVVEGSGYHTISRRFYESDLWTEPREFSRAEAFLDMIQLAAWKDHHKIVRGRRVEVARGSFMASERFLLRRWGWGSRGKVRRFLADCVFAGRIEHDPKTNRVTLCKFDRYQLRRTGDGPAADQPRTKEKKGKKEKKVEATPTRPAVAVALDSIPEALRCEPVEAAVREYVTYRGKIGHKALPDIGWTKLWNRLEGLAVQGVVAAFDRCMGSGNQGVFPSNPTPNAANRARKATTYRAAGSRPDDAEDYHRKVIRWQPDEEAESA
jgi:hypothetical protein